MMAVSLFVPVASAAVDPKVDAAVQAVYPALVRIHVVSEEGGGGRMQKGRSSGSGAIISPEGHILTNHHVAGRATRITVRLADRQLFGRDTTFVSLLVPASWRWQAAVDLVPQEFAGCPENALSPRAEAVSGDGQLAVAILPVIPASAGRLLDAMGIAPDLRSYSAIQSHWYSPLAESDFRLAQPVGLFPRLELPDEPA